MRFRAYGGMRCRKMIIGGKLPSFSSYLICLCSLQLQDSRESRIAAYSLTTFMAVLKVSTLVPNFC